MRGAPHNGLAAAISPTSLRISEFVGGTTMLTSARAPGPPTPQPVAMPADDRLGLDKHDSSAPTFPTMSQYDPEDAVPPPKPWPPDRTLQGPQLLAEREVFKDQFLMA